MSINNRTELQQKACDMARELIRCEKWFRGICCDNLPTDAEIQSMGLTEAAASIAFETAYWDAPVHELW